MAKKLYHDTEQYGSLTLKNAGGGCFLESDTNGSLCSKIAGKQVKFLTQNDYKIGDIFLTTCLSDPVSSPAERFGGSWKLLKDNAYLKIVTSCTIDENGKKTALGGTSKEHKIPIESMPSHNHKIVITDSSGTTRDTLQYIWNNGAIFQGCMQGAGGGEPYYPYYYGIFAWIKCDM